MKTRVTLFCLFMCSFITFFLIWVFNEQSNFRHVQKKPIHLLILTSWRSGSSFLGQIFNHHPNVFYLFEPARVVWVKLPNESPELLHYSIRDLLRSLFNCDMSPLHSYLPQKGKHISELGFWSESRALCSPPACKSVESSRSYNKYTCSKHCGNATLETISVVCKGHSHVVMKVVRILDLSVLLPLFKDPTLDLRILHLVRDPRAVASSRNYFPYLHQEDFIVNGGKEINKQPNITQVMAKICRAQIEINKVGVSLHRHYMVIRHEDLAREPLHYVKKVYLFADLNLFPEQDSWLYNITQRADPNEKGNMPFSGEARKIIQKWRQNLKHSTVLVIQDECMKAMEAFGYRPVKSIAEQKDLSLDLV